MLNEEWCPSLEKNHATKNQTSCWKKNLLNLFTSLTFFECIQDFFFSCQHVSVLNTQHSSFRIFKTMNFASDYVFLSPTDAEETEEVNVSGHYSPMMSPSVCLKFNFQFEIFSQFSFLLIYVGENQSQKSQHESCCYQVGFEIFFTVTLF